MDNQTPTETETAESIKATEDRRARQAERRAGQRKSGMLTLRR